MDPQVDYETDSTLAVFPSASAASDALESLARSRIHPDGWRQAPLEAGTYQLADTSMAEEAAGALRGVEVGAPVGAVMGFGLAASVVGGAPDATLAALAGAGALAGAVLGGLEGAVLRTRFDDDVSDSIEVAEDGSATLLALRTSSADGTTGRARRALRRAGAVAFLDPTTFEVD
jgi:hypothetical protein